MYKSEIEMHRCMDAVEYELDQEFGPKEEALRLRQLNQTTPDTEAPFEAWEAFARADQQEAHVSRRKKAAQAVSNFLAGTTEFDEFFEADPLLSPSKPKLA